MQKKWWTSKEEYFHFKVHIVGYMGTCFGTLTQGQLIWVTWVPASEHSLRASSFGLHGYLLLNTHSGPAHLGYMGTCF